MVGLHERRKVRGKQPFNMLLLPVAAVCLNRVFENLRGLSLFQIDQQMCTHKADMQSQKKLQLAIDEDDYDILTRRMSLVLR